MNEVSRTLDDMMREVLEAMPPGPLADKLGVLLRTYQRGGHPLISVGEGEGFQADDLIRCLVEQEYRRLTGATTDQNGTPCGGHGNGVVEQQKAVVMGRLDDGAARPH